MNGVHWGGGALLATALAVSLGAARAGDGGVSMGGPGSFSQRDGQELFQAICQGCHMSQGEGAQGAGAFPALAGNAKLVSAAYPLYTVMKGRKGMPSFASYLDDTQVANVVNYVRTHFGNRYIDRVTPEMVKAARR